MDRTKLIAASLLLGACASAPPAPRAVADAEIAFARDAQVRTVNEAFMSAFAPDAIIFRPTPKNAVEVFRTQPYPANMMLMWGPTSVETAAAGDLAVTTGPAQWGERGGTPTGTGYFVSVWRFSEGRWQVVIDAGTEAPIPAPVPEATRTLATRTLQPSPTRSDDIEQMRNDLLFADRRLSEDYFDDFRDFAASDVRVYRHGAAPTSTIGAAMTVLREDEDIAWVPQAAFVSRSGDLGYTYGVDKGSAETAYLRVWRNQDGNWKVAYDLKQ